MDIWLQVQGYVPPRNGLEAERIVASPRTKDTAELTLAIADGASILLREKPAPFEICDRCSFIIPYHRS